MDDYSKLSASDGTGEAVVANIESDRSIAAVTLDVDNVDNWPTDFICVTGTLNPNNYIDNSSMTIFYGHIDAGNIVIDSFAPGYTDVGNTAGQIAIIKPTTEWVNQIVELAQVAHQDNGKLKVTSLDEFYKPVEISSNNFISSGGVWTGDSYASTRAGSMTALVGYINGLRGTVSAVTARLFTASKDTYVDILSTAGVFSLVYTEVANGAAAPALAANSIRLAKVVTDATDIQAASSITQFGKDSLNNTYYPNGPVGGAELDSSELSSNMKIAYNSGSISPSASGETDLAGNGITLSFTVAHTCKAIVEVSIGCSSTSDFEFHPRVYLDGVLAQAFSPVAAPGFAANRAQQRTVKTVVTLTPGAHTMTGRIWLSSATTPSIGANGAYIHALVFGKVTA